MRIRASARHWIIAGAMLLSIACGAAHADQQSVIVTVDDQPITNYDVDQRLALWEILGNSKQNPTRKQALQSLIDDLIKIAAAKKNSVEAKEDMVNAHLERMAKGMQTDIKGLAEKLKKQGVSINALKQFTRPRSFPSTGCFCPSTRSTSRSILPKSTRRWRRLPPIRA